MSQSQLIRTLIADDEPCSRRRIRALLESERDIEILGECVDGRQTVDAVNSQRPDLVFLDIHMPYLDGFEALKRIDPENMPLIVFVTAYDQFALKAFEINATDYLLKPIGKNRFHATVARARSQILRNHNHGGYHSLMNTVESKRPYLDRVVVKNGQLVRLLNLSEVDWIDAAGNYAALHSQGKTHMIRKSLYTLEKSLDPQMFFRTHRSTIVNVLSVKSIRPHVKREYEVELVSGEYVPLSRRRRKKFNSFIRK